MENNAIVNTRLEELLGVMDPRANVTVFEKAEDGKEVIIASSKLYDILSGWFVNIYGCSWSCKHTYRGGVSNADTKTCGYD